SAGRRLGARRKGRGEQAGVRRCIDRRRITRRDLEEGGRPEIARDVDPAFSLVEAPEETGSVSRLVETVNGGWGTEGNPDLQDLAIGQSGYWSPGRRRVNRFVERPRLPIGARPGGGIEDRAILWIDCDRSRRDLLRSAIVDPRRGGNPGSSLVGGP